MTDVTGYQHILFSQLALEKPPICAMNGWSADQQVTDVTSARRPTGLCCTLKS